MNLMKNKVFGFVEGLENQVWELPDRILELPDRIWIGSIETWISVAISAQDFQRSGHLVPL